MLERSESLELLERQLSEKKHELVTATQQLNRNMSRLELAQAEALLACNHNQIWQMAHEHQLQAGQILLTLNQDLERLQTELHSLRQGAAKQLDDFQHFIRISQRALTPCLRTHHPNGVWQGILSHLMAEFELVLLSQTKLKHTMTKALKQLASGRQRRTAKIKTFQEMTQTCFAELTSLIDRELQNPEIETLQIQIRKQLEKRMNCVREVQRYQKVLDNILGMEQKKDVNPAKMQCELVQSYIHNVRQEQITIQAKIRLLRNPDSAANDVLDDIDDVPAPKKPKN